MVIFSALEPWRGFPPFQGEDWLVGISQNKGKVLWIEITGRVRIISCENAKCKMEDSLPRQPPILFRCPFFKMSAPTECSPVDHWMVIKHSWGVLTDSKHNCHHRCNNSSSWMCSVPVQGEKLPGRLRQADADGSSPERKYLIHSW